MITKTVIASLVLFSVLSSCSEKELTRDENIRQTIEVYLKDKTDKDNSGAELKITSVSIDSITPKQVLQLETKRLYDEIQANLLEVKKLQADYTDSKDLSHMYNSLNGGNADAFSHSSENTLEQLKADFNTKKQEGLELVTQLEKTIEMTKTADSLSIAYYEVFVKGTITTKNKVQEPFLFPFHISKDYKIIKEPTEFY